MGDNYSTAAQEFVKMHLKNKPTGEGNVDLAIAKTDASRKKAMANLGKVVSEGNEEAEERDLHEGTKGWKRIDKTTVGKFGTRSSIEASGMYNEYDSGHNTVDISISRNDGGNMSWEIFQSYRRQCKDIGAAKKMIMSVGKELLRANQNIEKMLKSNPVMDYRDLDQQKDNEPAPSMGSNG